MKEKCINLKPRVRKHKQRITLMAQTLCYSTKILKSSPLKRKRCFWKVPFMFNATNTASFLIILVADLQLFVNGEISQFLYISRKRYHSSCSYLVKGEIHNHSHPSAMFNQLVLRQGTKGPSIKAEAHRG